MTSPWLPDGFHTITPNIIADDAEQAVNFLKRAFGATENYRLTLSDGRITHCELKIGNSILNLGTTMEGWPAHGLIAQIFVEHPDALFGQAVQAGATVLMPMADMFFGIREGRLSDPFAGQLGAHRPSKSRFFNVAMSSEPRAQSVPAEDPLGHAASHARVFKRFECGLRADFCAPMDDRGHSRRRYHDGRSHGVREILLKWLGNCRGAVKMRHIRWFGRIRPLETRPPGSGAVPVSVARLVQSYCVG